MSTMRVRNCTVRVRSRRERTARSPPPTAADEVTTCPRQVSRAPALLEALPDVVVVADAGGQVVYANPAVRTLLGHEPADLHGRPLTVLVPPSGSGTPTTEGFARLLATGPAGPRGAPRRSTSCTPTGRRSRSRSPCRWLDGGTDGARLGERCLVGVLRDVQRLTCTARAPAPGGPVPRPPRSA